MCTLRLGQNHPINQAIRARLDQKRGVAPAPEVQPPAPTVKPLVPQVQPAAPVAKTPALVPEVQPLAPTTKAATPAPQTQPFAPPAAKQAAPQTLPAIMGNLADPMTQAPRTMRGVAPMKARF